MGKRNSGLIGERESVNPVLQEKRREKEMQRKRHKDSKFQPSGNSDSVRNGSNSLEKDIEFRAKAWKDAQQGFKAVPKQRQNSATFNCSSNEPVLPGAKYSLYFDATTNPSGKPPLHKPLAYRHPDGVIRSFPPAVSDSLSDDSSPSSSSSSDDEVVATIPMPVLRGSAPIPVKQPPPPRPMALAPKRPVLLPTFIDPPAATAEPIKDAVESESPSREAPIFQQEIVIESKPSMFIPSSLRRK